MLPEADERVAKVVGLMLPVRVMSVAEFRAIELADEMAPAVSAVPEVAVNELPEPLTTPAMV
jgi:hypothetical protein